MTAAVPLAVPSLFIPGRAGLWRPPSWLWSTSNKAQRLPSGKFSRFNSNGKYSRNGSAGTCCGGCCKYCSEGTPTSYDATIASVAACNCGPPSGGGSDGKLTTLPNGSYSVVPVTDPLFGVRTPCVWATAGGTNVGTWTRYNSGDSSCSVANFTANGRIFVERISTTQIQAWISGGSFFIPFYGTATPSDFTSPFTVNNSLAIGDCYTGYTVSSPTLGNLTSPVYGYGGSITLTPHY